MAAFHIVFDVLSQSSPAHVSSLQNMPLTSNPSSAYRWSTHTCSIWLIRKTDHAFQTMHQHLRTSLNDTTQRRKAQRCMDCQQSSLDLHGIVSKAPWALGSSITHNLNTQFLNLQLYQYISALWTAPRELGCANLVSTLWFQSNCSCGPKAADTEMHDSSTQCAHWMAFE